MRLSDFDYHLPEELIAQAPLAQRSASRLLLVNPHQQAVQDHQFVDLLDFFEPGDLLVFNDTRVIPARLQGRKSSGGKLEVLVERVLDDSMLLAQVRASRAPKPGSRLLLEDVIECCMLRREGDLFILSQDQGNWIELLERYGRIPLPPYIQDGDTDCDRYQTVFAREPGAVAAPTAGLHFDREILDALQTRGVNITHITLHVGAGTFQPVRGENIEDHVMHAERIEVPVAACEEIARTRAAGKRVVAVGTTVVRSLETAAAEGQLRPLQGESRLFIKPGFDFRVVDALLTNFHLPRSTLLMLVSAFAGQDLIRRAYLHAITQRYRFFSFGDAMFIVNRAGSVI